MVDGSFRKSVKVGHAFLPAAACAAHLGAGF